MKKIMFICSGNTCRSPLAEGLFKKYLRDNNMVRVSRSMRDTAYKSLAVKERLTAQNSKEPTAEEIAKELGISEGTVKSRINRAKAALKAALLKSGNIFSGLSVIHTETNGKEA